MSKHQFEIPKDPRIRRTQSLLKSALSQLLEEKQFRDVSITDICKQADIARVTFYQHYESKEALLIASVTDFFEGMHKAFDQSALDSYLATGNMTQLKSTYQMNLADQNQLRLIRVALQYAGAAVRQLTLASFLETYSQRETVLNKKEIQVLGTFYVGGMLTLLEQFLSDQLTSISQAELQAATLALLHASKQGVIQSNIFRDSLV
ncbi:MAG: TetR/AcrR family transcriptional regulator [Cyanobacteria bacterium P01_G01_bin.38]